MESEKKLLSARCLFRGSTPLEYRIKRAVAGLYLARYINICTYTWYTRVCVVLCACVRDHLATTRWKILPVIIMSFVDAGDTTRHDATRRHAPSSGFPHVNNSWNNRCRYSIMRQDGDADDVARKCHERNRFADSWFAETSPPRVAARPRRGVCTRRVREIHHVISMSSGKICKTHVAK